MGFCFNLGFVNRIEVKLEGSLKSFNYSKLWRDMLQSIQSESQIFKKAVLQIVYQAMDS